MPEIETDGVGAAESVARAEPVRPPLAVFAFDSVDVALMLAVADAVKLVVAVAAAEGEFEVVKDLPAVEVTDTEPVAVTDTVCVALTEGEAEAEPDTQKEDVSVPLWLGLPDSDEHSVRVGSGDLDAERAVLEQALSVEGK